MLSFARGRLNIDREFYTAISCFPFGDVALFGIGPGLYLDLAAFIFQLPNSDS